MYDLMDSAADGIDDSRSPWDDSTGFMEENADREWDKLANEHTNTGYREGITAGKESSLQEGFDDGFASVGAPLGRELGKLRGLVSGLLSHILTSSQPDSQRLEQEARSIYAALSKFRLSDLAPRDEQAELHAKEHGMETDTSTMETLEDSMNALSTGDRIAESRRQGREELELLESRIDYLLCEIGVGLRL